MRITLLRNTINATYHLGATSLTMVSEYTYLGLTLTNNMLWQTHINIISAKSNRMLGLIRRNLRCCSQKLRQQGYLTLVRPHLEYCSPGWNPHTKKNIAKIENIQRQAALFVFINYRRQESVSKMVKDLQWDTFETRRKAACLFLMYKIHHKLEAINPAHYLTPMVPCSTRSYHRYKYQIIPARIQIYQHSSFPRTVL